MPGIPNIGPRGARRRAARGTIALAAALPLGVALALGRAPVIGIAPYLILLWLGAVGVLQAHAGT
jgi:hypothetical protein